MDSIFALLAGFALIMIPALALRAAPGVEGKGLGIIIAWLGLLLAATFAAAWMFLLFIPTGLTGMVLALLVRRPLMRPRHDFVVEEGASTGEPEDKEASPDAEKI
jgi:hypothetical protein